MPYSQIKQYIELYNSSGIQHFFLDKLKTTITTEDNEKSIDNNPLVELKNDVKDCYNCSYNNSKIKSVFGEGSIESEIFIIGDYPNAEENMSGKSFTGGKYGEMFNKMILAMNIDMQLCFRTNITKCRPDRVFLQESKKCMNILDKQIDIIQPKIILVFGENPANIMFNQDNDIMTYRNNQPSQYKNIPMFITYNQATLLREPHLKQLAWKDLQDFNEFYNKIK
jgi:DNA polymerase